MGTEEEVIGIRAEAPDLKDLYHVEELTVNIADNGDGRRDVYDIGLFHKKLFRLGAYCFDYRFGKQFLLVKPLDAFVQINASYCIVSQLERKRETGRKAYWEGQACLVSVAVEELYPPDRCRFILVSARCFKAEWVFDLKIIVQLVLASKAASHFMNKLT